KHRNGTSSYNATLDLFRFLACLAIVWIHVPESGLLKPTTIVSRFAVPFFSAAAIYLTVRSLHRRPDLSSWDYIRARFRSIYLPFLAWSAIYYLARYLAKQVSEVGGLTATTCLPALSWETLLDGTVHHLWFLPYIVVASVAALAATKLVLSCPLLRLPVALVCLVTGFTTAVLTADEAPVPNIYAVELAYQTLPSACWAVAIALYADRWQWLGKADAAGILGSLLFFAGSAWLWQNGRNSLAENLAGCGLLLATLPDTFTRGLSVSGSLAKQLGAWSFGIYVVHILFVEGIQDVLHALQIEASPTIDLIIYVLSIIGSVAVTILASQFAGLSWLFSTRRQPKTAAAGTS
ncbi:MAG: acyltransferase, partial [Lacipirellulaceae bacterium]